MPLTNYPNGVSSFGMPVLPGPRPTTGNVFFVHSGTGVDGRDGTDPAAPLATIDAAVNKCTADKGDIIYVMPGHSEALAAAADIALDVAGISVIGLGTGDLKATVTFGTATTADIDVDADNVTIAGMRFVSAINSLANMIDVNAEYCLIEDCDFVTSSTYECLDFIDLATTKDFLTVRGCSFIQPTDPEGTDAAVNTGAIYFVDSEHILVENCYFNGFFESAILHNKTTAAKYVWVRNCYGIQALSGAEVFIQVATMSGGVQNSLFIIPNADDVSEAKTWGTLSANFYVDINSSVGNDGAGGQLAVAGASAAT